MKKPDGSWNLAARKAAATRRKKQGVYGGNSAFPSPKKDAVRSTWYASMGRRLFDGYHVVIASDVCGDIKELLKWGVPEDRIIACDVRESARRAAKAHKVVVSPEFSIVETVLWAQETYGEKALTSINVDLCGHVQMGAAVLKETIDPYYGPAKVAYTFSYGRDGMVGGVNTRITYLEKVLGFAVVDYTCYSAFTVDSEGPAPMCMVEVT